MSDELFIGLKRSEKLKEFLRRNWIIILIWFAALVIRILAAIFSKGYIHPDEQYQSIEVAYNEVFGFGKLPWEFIDGARSWLYPYIVVGIFKTMIFFGASNIETILIGVRLFSGLMSMITVVVAYFFGKKLFSKFVGIIASGFVAIWFDFVFWSTRTMTDSIAMNFFFLAAYLVYCIIQKENENTKKIEKKFFTKKTFQSFFAGISVGLAFMFKFPVAAIGLPLFIWIIVHKKWKELAFFTGAIILLVIVQGLIDLATWGSFLHSAITFLDYNIFSGGAASHGVDPFGTYAALLVDQYLEYFIIFLLFIIIALQKDKKTLYLGSIIVFYLLIFTIIQHKEYRFILPITSLLVLLAAKGFTKYPRFIRKANLRKGIYTFFIILTVVYAGAMSFSLKSFRPNNQHCLAFQYIGNLPDVDVVATLEGPEFGAPGLSYLQISVTYLTGSISNIDYYCTQYKSSTLYIVIHEKDYLKRETYLTTIFNVRGVSLNMTFLGTHERFDSTVLVFKKPIS
ncbi:MAG: phospholipid carrier-dependent glycosyltransferase [Candidatus Heimdallarchaeota archaeon]|nr:phospholipid carrier-dependent glycosyltransferase [Candidatus Heimdallarchaeota archaeon]MCG3253786.1 glycosyltransferase family 39 protein [Candidatus Heimdallarchaeota archaeon]MCK4290921.1 glycosyltransferase family 39 protein [Candidatus Heimdallarchaeota archaeon]